MNPKDLVGAKKAPLRYVPSALMIGASEAMFIGQEKYGPFNWRQQPVSAMTYVEAMQRHLAAWVDGQDEAEDTGINHLKHVAASVGILLDAMGLDGGLLDDRPTKGPAADLLRALDRSVISAPTPDPTEGCHLHPLGCEAGLADGEKCCNPGCRKCEVPCSKCCPRCPGHVVVPVVFYRTMRDIMCICPEERSRVNDHLLICPRWELS